MEHNHNPVNGQEQNYDYIFEELDRQENPPKWGCFLHHDGKIEPLTLRSLIKNWGVWFLFLGVFVAIVIMYKYDARLAVAPLGIFFMMIPIWLAIADKGKFRLRPAHYLFLIVGLVISYSSVAMHICSVKPFDMELFKERSVLGFGIGITVLGIALIAYHIVFDKRYCEKVKATFADARFRVYVNGDPFGDVTWSYEWAGRSYTCKTYNTTFGDLQIGATKKLRINPSRPERVRMEAEGDSMGWGVFYLFVGMYVVLSGLNNSYPIISYFIPVFIGIVILTVLSLLSFEGIGKFRPFPSLFIIYAVGMSFVCVGAASMYFAVHPQPEHIRSIIYDICFVAIGISTVILGILMIVSDNYRRKNCCTEVYACCMSIKPRGIIVEKVYGSITWSYIWHGNPYTSKTCNTYIEDFCEGRVGKILINSANPGHIRISEQVSTSGWGIFYISAGVIMTIAAHFLGQNFVLLN